MDITLLPNLGFLQKPFDLKVNEHGVVRSFYRFSCVNGREYLYIKVAQMNGFWACASDFNISTAGYGSPICIRDFTHTSFKEAVTSELQRILKYMDSNGLSEKFRKLIMKDISDWSILTEEKLFKNFKFVYYGV